jgi:hypothetical protein
MKYLKLCTLVLAIAIQPAVAKAQVEFKLQIDEITDETTPIIYLNPEENRDYILLSLRCGSDSIYLFADHKFLIGNRFAGYSSAQVNVDMRFDEQPATSSTWLLFDNQRVSFPGYPEGVVDNLILNATDSENLLFRMSDNYDQLTAHYSLTGFSDALDQFDQYCDTYSR